VTGNIVNDEVHVQIENSLASSDLFWPSVANLQGWILEVLIMKIDI
jgi:hypothetical protein